MDPHTPDRFKLPTMATVGGVLALSAAAVGIKWIADEREEAQKAVAEVLQRRLNEHEQDNSPDWLKLAGPERIDPNSQGGDLHLISRREPVAGMDRPFRPVSTELTFSDPEGLQAGNPSHFGLAIADLAHPHQPGELDPVLAEAIRAKLPFEISDDGLERAVTITAEMINGVAQDLAFAIPEDRYQQIVAKAVIDYKLSEAFIEAKKLYGFESFAELKDLSPEQWRDLALRISERSSLEKIQLGLAFAGEFPGYIQQWLFGKSGVEISWLMQGE